MSSDTHDRDSLTAIRHAASQLLNDIEAMRLGPAEEFGEFSD